MAPNLSVKSALFLVASAALVNFLLVGGMLGTIPFNIVRVLLSIWAGWLVVSSVGLGLLGAAGAGVLVMAVDHLILKGGFFLSAHFFWPQIVEGEGLTASLGVLVSFVMFSPIAALLGVGGGLFYRWRVKRAPANP